MAGLSGWNGRALELDLDRSRVRDLPLDDTLLLEYVGGRGLGAKLLYDLFEPGTDPLSPRNPLIFTVGPLDGTPAPTSGRYSVTAKSPLTGTIFDSNSGGHLGPALKACGIDALIIRGAAKDPIYIHLTPKKLEVLDAGELWGLDVVETTDRLTELYGPKAKVACIGPAGENLVRFASIMNDKHRTAGRGGMGAVMGSKRVKALVVSDYRIGLNVADRATFLFFVKEANKLIAQNPVTSKALPKYGTSAIMNLINLLGILPTKNFQTGSFAHAEEVSGEAITERILVGQVACYACPIACGRETATSNGHGEGPEFETVYAFGAMLLNPDLEDIAEVGYLCNRLGMDTISMGVTLACAMELSERGHLPESVRWGDQKAIRRLVTATAHRDGLGDLLAEGSRRLAERCGAPDVAMAVKGLELPAYDPRGSKGMGLAYATSNRGGCHLRAYMIDLEVLGLPKRIDRFSPHGKAGLCVVEQDLSAAVDTLVMCRFTQFALTEEHYARLLTAATGHTYTPEDFMRVGERIWNLERLFNLREGFTRADDTLPRRLLEEPLKEGPTAGRVVELDLMLAEYYEARGWDQDGVPTKEKLQELGLA
jgi:aldehyde:ferredoxin oxidoreductase